MAGCVTAGAASCLGGLSCCVLAAVVGGGGGTPEALAARLCCLGGLPLPFFFGAGVGVGGGVMEGEELLEGDTAILRARREEM